jgi:hypothetical protein
MQELLMDEFSKSGRLRYVEVTRIYLTSTGEIIMPMGNVRMLDNLKMRDSTSTTC